MADINGNASSSAAGNMNRFREAVSVSADRIFDACSDRECLEDLQVYFTEEEIGLLEGASQVKCRAAEVMDMELALEPVAFNPGYFRANMTFYFRLHFTLSPSGNEMAGLAYHSKQVVLFGGERAVRTFRSGGLASRLDTLPVANVHITEPIVLLSRVVEAAPVYAEALGSIPAGVAGAFGGQLQATPLQQGRTVLVTLGLFYIVTLEREVQLLIPVYDYSVPEKDCTMNTAMSEEPCEAFRRVAFPVEDFFPENITR